MTSEFDALQDEGPVVVDVEALRLADALVTLELGGTPDISTAEDPELASLIRTVGFLRADAQEATQTASYLSYHARSRAYVLHTLEQRAPAPQPMSIETARSLETRRGILSHIDPFLQRHRRWTFATPIAAAAAAAALFFFGVPAAAPADGEPRPAVASNQTAATADAELARIQFTLATIANRSANGQTVDATLLRTVTETTSAVANRIETAPQTISREHVANYQRTVATGNFVLGAAQPTAGSEDALAAAQRATQDGSVTAARFLGADEATPTTVAPRPSVAATATPPAPSVTPTATPTYTSTAPTPTATPAPASAAGTEGAVRP
jgi:hypothetical protein